MWKVTSHVVKMKNIFILFNTKCYFSQELSYFKIYNFMFVIDVVLALIGIEVICNFLVFIYTLKALNLNWQ